MTSHRRNSGSSRAIRHNTSIAVSGSAASAGVNANGGAGGSNSPVGLPTCVDCLESYASNCFSRFAWRSKRRRCFFAVWLPFFAIVTLVNIGIVRAPLSRAPLPANCPLAFSASLRCAHRGLRNVFATASLPVFPALWHGDVPRNTCGRCSKRLWRAAPSWRMDSLQEWRRSRPA